MNKKAQIAKTITWTIAVIIVLFIMALFLLGAGAISAKKLSLNIFSSEEKQESFDKSALNIQYPLANFLSSEYYEREHYKKVRDVLMQDSNDIYSPELEKHAEYFFNKIYGTKENWKLYEIIGERNDRLIEGSLTCGIKWKYASYVLKKKIIVLCANTEVKNE